MKYKITIGLLNVKRNWISEQQKSLENQTTTVSVNV